MHYSLLCISLTLPSLFQIHSAIVLHSYWTNNASFIAVYFTYSSLFIRISCANAFKTGHKEISDVTIISGLFITSQRTSQSGFNKLVGSSKNLYMVALRAIKKIWESKSNSGYLTLLSSENLEINFSLLWTLANFNKLAIFGPEKV